MLGPERQSARDPAPAVASRAGVKIGMGFVAHTAPDIAPITPYPQRLVASLMAGARTIVSRVQPPDLHPPAGPICRRPPTQGRRLAARAEVGWVQVSGHQDRQRCP